MSFNESNGILAKIPGALVSRGMDGFPPAGDGQAAEMQGEVDVPDIGRVRIRYRLKCSRHHKNTHWFWGACFAELVN